jgi:hypothetical protein
MSDRNTQHKAGELLPFKVATNTTIEAGKMVSVNSSGFAIPAADTASTIVVGIADEAVVNAGADGAKTVNVRRGRVFKLKNSGTTALTQAAVGSNVYVQDAETVAPASVPTNDIVAGKCLGVDTDGVWVAIV